MNAFPLLVSGLFLGLLHVFEADHVAAASALVSRTRDPKKSALLGAYWGLGHASTVLVVGLCLLISKVRIPPGLFPWFELAVGLMLVILGLDVFRAIKDEGMHFHAHAHGANAHAHFHIHDNSGHEHMHRSFFVGTIHGLAGSAALLLLALASAEHIWQGLLFIVAFGIGLIIGMSVFTGFVGLPLSRPEKFKKIGLYVRWASGLASVAVGTFAIGAFISTRL